MAIPRRLAQIGRLEWDGTEAVLPTDGSSQTELPGGTADAKRTADLDSDARIEQEIIPRLILARRGARNGFAYAKRWPALGRTQVLEFAGMSCSARMPSGLRLYRRARAYGMPVETLYLDLLAPAARHLGELWCADACDFASVTLALGRLQEVCIS